MSPDSQRIAIAEACGIVSKDKWGSLYKTPRGILRDCPDYLADLNAMHEAEETLHESQRVTYSNELYDLAVEHQLNTSKWRYLSMTASQRAEAFLRTIGKWEHSHSSVRDTYKL